MNIGSSSVTAVYLGSTSVSSAFLGSIQVFGGASVFNPEANLGNPNATAAPSQFDWTGPATGSEQVVFAFDFVFTDPAPSQGMIFEQGGSGRGSLIIVREGYMRFRFGDGATSFSVNTVQGHSPSSGGSYVYDVPLSSFPFDGNQHTLVWEVDPRSATPGHRAWIDGTLLFDSRGLGNVDANQWSGSAGGGFLTHATNMGGDSNFDANWPVQTGQARLYINKLVS